MALDELPRFAVNDLVMQDFIDLDFVSLGSPCDRGEEVSTRSFGSHLGQELSSQTLLA